MTNVEQVKSKLLVEKVSIILTQSDSHEVIVKLIATTSNKAGLKVECQLDTNIYPKAIKVSDEEMADIDIQRDSFHR